VNGQADIGAFEYGAGNAPPSVNAGTNQTLIVNSLPAVANLSGTGTDDGLPYGQTNVTWSQVSGPGTITFGNSNLLATTANLPNAGIYTQQLVVSDGSLAATSTVTITVRLNQPPTANAGTNQTLTVYGLPAVANLNGTGTDDGLPSGVTNVLWSGTGPGMVTFSNAAQQTTTATFTNAGVYNLQLTANDSVLYTTSTPITVTVNLLSNQPPVVSAGVNQYVTLPAVANMKGTATDDGLPCGQTNVTWRQVSGPGAATFGSSNQLTTTASFTTAGTYVLQLVASDTALASTSTVSVFVDPTGLWYVNALGNDANNGSRSLPFQTIKKAVAVASSGDTIKITSTVQTENSIFLGKSLNIIGDGGFPGTIIQAASSRLTATNRIFWSTNDNIAVTFSNLTLQYGFARNDQHGGAIKMSGYSTLALQNCTVQNNDATNANPYGGGVYSRGTTTVSSCTFAGNTAGRGGALAHDVGAGAYPFNIYNCTFSGNAATNGTPGDGGAIYELRPSGSACTSTCYNCTFVSNNAATYGGAILASQYAYMLVGSSVFATNKCPTAYSGYYCAVTNSVYDGGIFSAVFVSSTDKGSNLATNSPGVNLAAAYNGGPTKTHALLTGSASIDKGTNVLGLATDQRGTGFARVVGTKADCGAYEYGAGGANQGPTVDAGPAQTVSIQVSASLDGTVFDDGLPNGTINAAWSLMSGPGTVTFGNSNQVDTTATFPTNGTYVLQLWATDGALSSSGTVTMAVILATNCPPTVYAGTNQTIELPAIANLSGTASDDGLPNGVLTYQWSQLTGPAGVSFGNLYQTNTTASFPTSPTTTVYVLQLLASDTALSSASTVQVTVNPVNQAPVVNAGINQNITLPANASLNGTVTDDGYPCGVTNNAWSMLSGPGTVTFGNSNLLATTASFSTNGTYVLQLWGSDTALSTTSTNVITVNPAPPPTPASIVTQPSNQTVNEGSAATFTVTAAGTAPLYYQWQTISIDTNSDTVFTNSIVGATQHSYTTPATVFATDNGTVFQVVVSNAWGAVVSSAVVLNVKPIVLGQSMNVTVAADQSVVFTLATSPGPGTNFQLKVGGAFGTLTTPTSGVWTYTPKQYYSGQDWFYFTGMYSNVVSTKGFVYVTVTPTNHAPVAVSRSVVTLTNQPVNMALLAWDPDGDAMTYSSMSSPGSGYLTNFSAAGNCTYVPNTGFSGSDSFTFRVSDGQFNSQTATQYIRVVTSGTVTGGTVVLQQGLNGYTNCADTYIAGSAGNSNVNNGTYTYLRYSVPPDTALIKFGNIFQSQGGPIPNNAVIQKATLTLFKTLYAVLPEAFGAYQMLRDWSETQATWNIAKSGVSWSGLGCSGLGTDVAALYDDVGTNGFAVGSPMVLDVTPSVSAWAAGMPNYGWNLDQMVPVNSGTYFATRENTNQTLRPMLTVTWFTGAISNTPPVAYAQCASSTGTNPVSITLTGSDPNGLSLTYTPVSTPALGTLSGTPPNLTYTPTQPLTTDDSFQFRVSDSVSSSAVAYVSILPAVPQPTGTITIDGNPSEADWNNALQLPLSVSADPNLGPLAPTNYATTVKVLADSNYLYFAFTCPETNSIPYTFTNLAQWIKAQATSLEYSNRLQTVESDYVAVELELGKYGHFRTVLTLVNWQGNTYQVAPMDYCLWYCNENKYFAPPGFTHVAACSLQPGQYWNAEVRIAWTNVLRHPSDGIPQNIGLNFRRVEWGPNGLTNIGFCDWFDAIDSSNPNTMFNRGKEHYKRMATWQKIDITKLAHSNMGFDRPTAQDEFLTSIGYVSLNCGTIANKLIANAGNVLVAHREYTGNAVLINQPRIEQLEDTYVSSFPATPKVYTAITSPPPASVIGLASGPTVTALGGGQFSIAFSVSNYTDVAVLITDTNNVPVRHIVAGVLGSNAPAPFVCGSLAQTVVWDGRDDSGTVAPAGVTYRAQVMLGLQATYARSLAISQSASDLKGDNNPAGGEGYPFMLDVDNLPNPTVYLTAGNHLAGGGNQTALNREAYPETILVPGALGGTPNFYNYDDTGALLGNWQFASNTLEFGSQGYVQAGEPVFDGNLMFQDAVNELFRVDLSGNPLNFSSMTRSFIADTRTYHDNPHRGLCVGGPSNDIYIVNSWFAHGNERGTVSRVGTDGRIKDLSAVASGTQLGGVKVDRAGNIYVGAAVRPANQRLPSDLSAELSNPSLGAAAAFYEYFYGSIIKFNPAGGRILTQNPEVLDGNVLLDLPQPRCTIGWDPGKANYVCCQTLAAQFVPCQLFGAQWVLPGYSPIVNRSGDEGIGLECCCMTPRFDLDGYDRVFYPDGVFGRILVADSNGNRIMTFGSRGYDPTALQFRWAERVDVSDNFCYVCDLENNSQAGVEVQVQLSYTQTGTAQFTK